MTQNKLTSTKSPGDSNRARHKPTNIVGIGASAGGLSALEEFFDYMPSDSGMAFVIIQHLSPDFKSLMDDLLARHTDMEIHRVTDGIKLKPNSIYLIPPKSHMTVSKGKLFLTEVNKNSQQTELPIDVFFNSLAVDGGKSSIAVILSGTGTDGSRGIKAIHNSGGLVLVQSIDTAQFDGMPRSAIATGFCDLMVAPQTMPEIILNVAGKGGTERNEALSKYLDLEPEGKNSQIFAILKSHYNLDFSKYKDTTVGRRIQRRMNFHKINAINKYISLLASDVDELNALYHDLLIGVTEFFRDPKVFERLEQEVIPQIFERHAPDDDIRVWCAGCATGEEAYSIGILFSEKAQEYNYKGNITVFATDVHRTSLDTASQGRFDRERLKNVSTERLERFFEISGDEHYHVNQSLRKMIVFAPHNLINDPPFTRMDLVTCRNLLIYLQADIQDKVLSLFHFALNVQGYLFLGSSEGLGKISAEFEIVDSKGKIFKKLRDLNIAISMNLDNVPTRFSAPSVVPVSSQKNISIDRKLVNDYDYLLKEYMPPGVLIDQDRRIMHNFGDVSFFIRQVEGRFENDILTMIEDDLKVPLTTALHRSVKIRDQVVTRGIGIKRDDGTRRFDLVVKYIPHRNSGDGHYFITLLPTKKEQATEDVQYEISSDVEFNDLPKHLQQRIFELEQELQGTKESLQTSIEELQTANEELQTTNEELMASNEELQSTNEELHSVNEELYTVNSEFEDKNRELKALNQDHVNLLNSLESGIVYVDTHLKIRKFNHAIEKIFKILPQDVGRPIDHIAYHLANQSRMLKSIQKVLKTGEQIEREVQTSDGQWLFKRVLPFRNDTSEIQGAILMFTDITSLKEAENKIQRHADDLEQAVQKRTLSLQEAKNLADQANSAKSAFLANMSHEIRTPMSGVLMAAELLAETNMSAEQANLLKTLQKGAGNLNTILDDILDFSKIEAGKVDLLKEPFNIEETVYEIMNLYQPKANIKGLNFNLIISENVPKVLLGDQLRLKQVLTNLISNAVKFTHKGSVEIIVNLEKTRTKHCILHFEINDSGIGLSEDSEEYIFEPFAQGDHSLTRNYGGTGLGLAISKRLIELMGGKIWVVKREEGASFHFTIVVELVNKESVVNGHGNADINPDQTVKGCKVLLAEDDELNQDLISNMLKKFECEFELVNNGEEAIEALNKQQFDLVLMDISMPVMDGVTATEIIRQLNKKHLNYDVPIVALTAHAMESDTKKFIGSGMNQVLKKPLSLNALTKVINNHCRNKAYRE